MLQVRSVWTGFKGAPGYTNMYFDGGDDPDVVINLVEAFWNACGFAIPSVVTITVEGAGLIVDEATGTATGSWVSTIGDQAVAGAGTGDYMGPAGLCVTWRTASIIGGRRVRGRTFIVPAPTAITDADGTVDGSLLGTVRTAANTLATAGTATFGVWHRPGTGVGSFEPVISSSVSDQLAVLRSRRD